MEILEQPIAPNWDECMQLLGDFPTFSLDKRMLAVDRLLHNPSPEIRMQALRIGAGILPDEQLVNYLRSETDDVRRNAGLEILKLRGSKAFSLAISLLQNEDSDVVLQAILVLDHLKDPRAFESIRPLLRHPEPNVVQAAIVAVGHLGDSRAVADLLPFLTQDFWFQMAAVQALGDLRTPTAIPVLNSLLVDPLLSPLANEAMARIGGRAAFRALAENWVKGHHRLEAETKLGLMAHILEGQSFKPGIIPGFRESVVLFLEDANYKIQKPAAACLLAMEPGNEDHRALEILAAQFEEKSTSLPGCLRFRVDLVHHMLVQAGVMLSWGIQLASIFPQATNPTIFAEALMRFELPDPPDEITRILTGMHSSSFGAALLDLYQRTPRSLRRSLIPILKANSEVVLAQLQDQTTIDLETRVVLTAHLESSAEIAVALILALPGDQQKIILPQISECANVIRQLPWEEWLGQNPNVYTSLAAELLTVGNYPELLPLLRKLLTGPLSVNLIRIFAKYRDSETLSTLSTLLTHEKLGPNTAAMQAIILETIGQIGGEEARNILAGFLCSPDPKIHRVAFRSLSLCATEEDLPLFRQALSSDDWLIRLASVEALGRFPHPENLVPLLQMAADPTAIVAQRAIALIEKGVES